MPPTGRATYPTANVPNEAMIATEGGIARKNTGPKTSVAAVE